VTVRVLVVDDHELFREGVVATLESELDFEVVGQAGSGGEALRAASELRPDLILLDLYMPGGTGLSVLPTLRDELPETHVVMLTISEDPEAVTQALRDGASGYLVKGIRAEAFLEALRAVMVGESYVSPAVAGHVLRELQRDQPGRSDIESLTKRERDVLQLLARGRTNREIAEALVISEKTVKRHVTGIFGKLNARNRTEAALRALDVAHGVPPLAEPERET
jgi:DNA-binding NarL/FixJ family response regulator